MKPFKFLQIIRKPESFLSFIKLKNPQNRDRYLQVMWEERLPNFDDSDVLRFEGNIYEFYCKMGPGTQFGVQRTPTIYEIYKKQQGYFDRSLIFSENILRSSFFISRRAKLTILYKIT